MAATPPTERIWWKEPIAKTELAWIFIALLWGLVMFFMMIYWHGRGNQNLSNGQGPGNGGSVPNR